MWLFKSEVFIELGSDFTIAEALVLEIITQIRRERERENLPPPETPPRCWLLGSLLCEKLRVGQSDLKVFKLKVGGL